MNYDILMDEQIKKIPEGTELLLHACSSAVLERIASHFKIVIFYYNPNIDKEEEYNKRVRELEKFIKNFETKYEVSLIEGKYEPERFFEVAKGLENEPERGSRCFKCYKLRLEETARIAEELGYKYFCTTLTLSPHKNSNWLNEIGKELENEYQTSYLYSDFKKKNGYKRSIELSREYNLYRQDYCGCIYSKKDR